MEQTLGKRIVQNRKRLGLTQDQLAEKLGVTAQAVSKWENNQSCPDISTLPRLAEIFGISVDALLGRTPEEPVHEAEVIGREDEAEPEGIHVKKGNWEFQWDGGKLHAVAFAVLVLAVGCLTLADKIFHWEVGFWGILWPAALLVWGFAGLLRRFRFFSLGCTIFGGYFLLDNIGILPFSLGSELVFPILLVLLGVSLLVDAFRKSYRRKGSHVHVSGKGKKFSSDCTTTEDGFACSTAFGENTHWITLPRLARGSAECSFGTLTLDLSGVDSLAESCAVDVECSFGEVILQVPSRYLVDPHSSTAFASVSVQGQPDPNPAGVMRLNADVSFGEIRICYIPTV